MADLPNETPVLVVGGGPVGLTMSILLTRLGVDHVLVERRSEVQVAPAAHVVNARTFEILRAAGVDMARIEAACRPPSDGWVRWVTQLTGEEIGHVPFEGQHRIAELLDITPTPLRNLSQHRLEPILRDHTPTLVEGVEWVSAERDGDTVVSELRDVATGAVSTVRSRTVVAADGAGSRVRRWAGIGMTGPQRLQSFISIHVEADLRHLVAHRPATLYWVLDPDIGGTFVAHDIDSTWVYMHVWNPDTERLQDYDDERCAAIFTRAVGADIGPVHVRSITPWNMSCQVADRYRDDGVFLIGDAAHRFPPTGGMGLNTGVVDAQNLAWKLAAVHHGWAPHSLLDTYEAERRPIAETNAQQSLENAMKLFEVAMALGVDADHDITRTNYRAAVDTAEGRARVRAAAEGQAEHFDMLGLQLGFRYLPAGGAVTAGEGNPGLPDDPVRDYPPSTYPGARLPHAWVRRDGRVVSTLDLVPLDRFVLITASPSWAAAGAALASDGPPVDVVLVGRDVTDHDGHWQRAGGLGADGALLVRPDQHVGWRALSYVDDAVDVLRAALAICVGAAR